MLVSADEWSLMNDTLSPGVCDHASCDCLQNCVVFVWRATLLQLSRVRYVCTYGAGRHACIAAASSCFNSAFVLLFASSI